MPWHFLHVSCRSAMRLFTPAPYRLFSTALSAAHTRGMMSVLRSDKFFLSPVIGLLSLSSSVFIGNIYRCEAMADFGIGLGHAHSLARDLFHPVGDTLKATRSRSQAAYYLDPPILGHMLGLALSNAPECVIRTTLKQCGIESNKFQGVFTGISLVRYMRIVQLIRESLHCEWSPVIPLFLRLVWEKATSKKCLLNFLRAMDTHYSVLLPSFRDNPRLQNEWLEQRFDLCDVSDEKVAQAAKTVLDPNDDNFALSMELVATSLSLVHAFKPAVAMQRHQYKNGTKIIGDCVEVVIREIFDLLLFDPERLMFDPNRLPKSSSSQLVAFYQELQTDSDLSSTKWYHICQGLPNCEYIEMTPDGQPYELYPSLQSVGKAVGALLGQQLSTLQDLEQVWNTRTNSDSRSILKIETSQAVDRSLLNDEKALRQMAEIRLGYNHHFIRVCLEGSRHFASVTHCQKSNAWRDDVRELHAQAFLSGKISPCLQSLWPLCLGSVMLNQCTFTSQAQFVYSILCTPLDSDRFRWSPTQDLQSGANMNLNAASVAKIRSDSVAIKALESVGSSKEFSELLPWVLSQTLTLDPIDVSLALRKISADVLALPRVARALARRPDGFLLLSMLRFACGEVRFPAVWIGLGLRKSFQFSRFWVSLKLIRLRS